MLISIALIVLNILISAVGQLMLKAGMTQVGKIGAEEMLHPVEALTRIFTTPLILAALPLYGGALVMWLVVLSRLKLSFAYPLLAMTYALNPLLAQSVLHEKIATQQWMGIGVIFAGVLIVINTHK